MALYRSRSVEAGNAAPDCDYTEIIRCFEKDTGVEVKSA